MQYDPIKRSLGRVFNRTPRLRKGFYKLLDLLLLRSWHIHKELRKWAKDKRNQEVSVLDAGAGFGQYTYYMSKVSPRWDILAVDVKEEQVADCNQFFHQIGKDNVQFAVKDLVTYQNPESFDLILSVDVMEHILKDVEVFRNFYVSLKNNGMLLISTPSDQGGSDVHDDSAESFIEEHVRDGYNINEIEDKLREAGFDEVEARYAYGKPGQVSWRLSMKWPLLALNKTRLAFLGLPVYYLVTYPFSYFLNYIDTHRRHDTGTGLIVKAWKKKAAG